MLLLADDAAAATVVVALIVLVLVDVVGGFALDAAVAVDAVLVLGLAVTGAVKIKK